MKHSQTQILNRCGKHVKRSSNMVGLTPLQDYWFSPVARPQAGSYLPVSPMLLAVPLETILLSQSPCVCGCSALNESFWLLPSFRSLVKCLVATFINQQAIPCLAPYLAVFFLIVCTSPWNHPLIMLIYTFLTSPPLEGSFIKAGFCSPPGAPEPDWWLVSEKIFISHNKEFQDSYLQNMNVSREKSHQIFPLIFGAL